MAAPTDLVPGLLRRARRDADLSQRELAKLAGVDRAVVGRLESSARRARFDTMVRLLGAAGCRLAVIDANGRELAPLGAGRARDRAGRQFPAHLDVRVWRRSGDWWWDYFNTSFFQEPAYSFDRARRRRDLRRVSVGRSKCWGEGWVSWTGEPSPRAARIFRIVGAPDDERDQPPRPTFRPERPVASPRLWWPPVLSQSRRR